MQKNAYLEFILILVVTWETDIYLSFGSKMIWSSNHKVFAKNLQCDLLMLLIFLRVLNIKWPRYAGHPLDEDLLIVKPIIYLNIQSYQTNLSFLRFRKYLVDGVKSYLISKHLRVLSKKVNETWHRHLNLIYVAKLAVFLNELL